MVRNIQIEAVDNISRPLIAVGNDYPDGHKIAPHQHRRGQLISGATGVLVLSTPNGRWVMPPQRGMWIPPGVVHDVSVIGGVRMQSLYLQPEMTDAMPENCQVVSISPFMRSLISEALELPVEYDPDSRAGALMTLILYEMRRLPVLPLSLAYPAHGPLAERCRSFLQRPRSTDTIEDWSSALGMSRRSFTRLFRQETGLSFLTWRQQACLVMALPRLISGETVTSVAIDLGYDNPAAFTAMFKRALGAAPRAYVQQNET
jgi:AraC-like DNA-binding protein